MGYYYLSGKGRGPLPEGSYPGGPTGGPLPGGAPYPGGPAIPPQPSGAPVGSPPPGHYQNGGHWDWIPPKYIWHGTHWDLVQPGQWIWHSNY